MIINPSTGIIIMIDLAREIIGTQPILAAFLAIGLGYLVGQVNLGGFSLGVGAVLFVGLAIGAFAPKAQITGPIGLTGLIMFLYGIGILYGRQFFEGMTGSAGRKYNLLAFVGVIAGLLVALGLGQMFGIKVGHTLGIYAGSMTSTATLQAALDVMNNKEPSIGYSIAYPFGVIGPILCIYFLTRTVQPTFPSKVPKFHMGEVTLGASYAGRKLDELDLPSGVQVTMVRQKDQNVIPTQDVILNAGDGLMIVADEQRAIAGDGRTAGKARPGSHRQGPFRAGLPQGFRRQGQPRRHPVGAARHAERLSRPHASCSPLRHGHRTDAGSDVGIRRSRRPAAATRTQGGGEDLFRRYRSKRPRNSAMCRWVSAWFWASCWASFRFRSPVSGSSRLVSRAGH